jgi:hypothetical protein
VPDENETFPFRAEASRQYHNLHDNPAFQAKIRGTVRSFMFTQHWQIIAQRPPNLNQKQSQIRLPTAHPRTRLISSVILLSLHEFGSIVSACNDI